MVDILPFKRPMANYRVIFPDGKGCTRRSHNAIQPMAHAQVIFTDGKWVTCGIYDTLPPWAGQPYARGVKRVFVKAERIG